MNKDKFDKNGFDENGLNINGTYYDEYGFDAFRRNEDGLTFEQVFCRNGYDKEGYDKYGFNKEGFNRLGVHKDRIDLKIDIDKEISKIIGLDNVKEVIKGQYNRLLARDIRRNAGIEVDDSQALNMIFTGNPGTGKTMAARIIGKLFKEFGIIKEERIVEVDRSMLVGQYQGATAKKTSEVFKSALGGILIIDEAYSLYNGEMDEAGREAINTLVKLIEDYRNEVIVILTGYKKEMNDFININSGIKSRFSIYLEFNDYNIVELKTIFKKMLNERGFVIEKDIEDFLTRTIEDSVKKSYRETGNGRMIRNLVEKSIRNQSLRIVEKNVKSGFNVIKKEDIEEKLNIVQGNLKDELEKIVGKKELKDLLKSIDAKLTMNNNKRKMGLHVEEGLHNFLFKGSIGTGKSIAVSAIATIFYNNGILKTRNIVEVSRGDLVGAHIGETSIKAKKKIEEAVLGVLFVENAENLLGHVDGDYGREALNEIIRAIDRYKERLVVILSGEPKGIDRLLSENIGLKSRFKYNVDFEDYTTDELIDILLGKFEKGGYTLDLITLEKIKGYLEDKDTSDNGRYIEEFYEKIQMNMAKRLYKKEDLTKEDLIEIKEEDIY